MSYKIINSSKLKISIFFAAFLLVNQCTLKQADAVQDLLKPLRTIWKNREYSKVIPLLINHRKTLYGKNPEVDYMIATSLCRQPSLREDGYKFFKWVLYNYSLDKESQNLVKKEMQQCTPARQPIKINFSASLATAHVGGKTKLFFGANEEAIISSPVEVVKQIPFNEFTNRLFEPSDRANSIKYIKNLVGSEFQVESIGQFILVSSSGQSQSDLQFIGRVLQKTIRSFTTQYKMPIPKYLITMYLLPSRSELQEFSQEIHGIKMPKASIGYSFQNDLSMVGVVPSVAVGTLIHELFHLQVHSEFGDVPPWLDEGIAALYEESEFRGDTILGKPNWRGRILKEAWEIRPSIEALVKMDWSAFDNLNNTQEIQQATNHAMARYFMLYLQDKKKLTVVYDAFRNRMPANVKTNPAVDAVLLLESVLQQPISEVDKDFTEWFKSLR